MTAFEHIVEETITTANEEKLACLNQMLDSWRSLFEEPPVTKFAFAVNEQNILCLDNIPICDMADVDAQSACCDVEALFFDTMTNGYYRILILWDFDNNVSIREISLVLYEGSEDD